MPKHKKKQRRSNWNSGYQGNNWQNPNNSYQNDLCSMGQNYFNNTYYNPSFQHNVAQSYSNNFFDPSYQNGMGLNYNNSYFYPNNSNSNFSPSFPGNCTQNGQRTMRQSNRYNDVQINTIKNVKSDNFNDKINYVTKSNSDINRSLQGNISHKINNAIKPQMNTQNYIETKLIDNETNLSNSIPQNDPKNTLHNPWDTESQLKLKNARKLLVENKLKARIDGYEKKTQLFNEKGYIIKESLYKDPSLFQAHGDSINDQQNSNETNDEWTDAFWTKHKDSSLQDHSRMSQDIGKVTKKNQNRFEKSLNKMLAQPAEMSKGMSLLQKMGWTGGGLGRDGDGIVEPIAPKATYAVKTIGLGHLTERVENPKKSKPFSQVKKHQFKSPEFQNNFCMNILLYVLQFVKNDEENKIVFEPRLTKGERKRIHNFIEKIRECSNLDDFDDIKHLTAKHFALIKDIWVHNCYELWTESEGEGQDRRLCLYKEAPAHVYLVTPDDLTKNDENGTNDDSGKDNVQETEELLSSDVKDNIQSKNEQNIITDDQKILCLPKIKSEHDENINSCDKVKNKMEINEPAIKSECKDDEKDNIQGENGSGSETNINLCYEIERKMEMNDPAINTNDQDIVLKEIKLETQKGMINKSEKSLPNDNKVLGKIKSGNDEKVSSVKEMNLNDKAIEKIISEYDKNINLEEKMDSDAKSIKTDENDSILRKIVKYFKEFLEDAVFKEFRFLGPFSGEELMNINLFFDICMELDDGEGEEKDELLKLFDDESLEVLEDNNGKRFIHKKEENQQSPPQSEDHSSKNVLCLD